MIKKSSPILLALFILAIASFIFVPQKSYALNINDLEISEQKVNPDSFYYPFKRMMEKVREIIAHSPKRKIVNTQTSIDKRLSELDYVTRNEMVSEVEKSSNRLSFYVGRLIEYYDEFGEPEEKNEVKKKYQQYSEFLSEIRDRYPANSSNWLFVQQNMDTMNLLINKL